MNDNFYSLNRVKSKAIHCIPMNATFFDFSTRKIPIRLAVKTLINEPIKNCHKVFPKINQPNHNNLASTKLFSKNTEIQTATS